MTKYSLYIVLLFVLHFFLGSTKYINTIDSKPFEDTIRQKVQFVMEEKQLSFTLNMEKETFLLKTYSKQNKTAQLFYTDTIVNKITTFEVNNVSFVVELYKDKTKIFSGKLDKASDLKPFYSHNYSYITSSNAPVLKKYLPQHNLYVFDLDLGNQIIYFVMNAQGKVAHIGKGAFLTQKNNFIASLHEIYSIKKGSVLNFHDYYLSKFKNTDYELESYFEILTDSTFMLTYFYETNFYNDLRNNLLILNDKFEIIKQTTIQKCPDTNFEFKLFDNFLTFFSAKFERIWLYSIRENKFNIIIPDCDCVHTESGNVMPENKEQNETNLMLIREEQKKHQNTILFISYCPKHTTYSFQIDTLNKKIMSCQVNQFRQ